MSDNVYPFPGMNPPARAGWLERRAEEISRWRESQRKRRELEKMDDALLADIGIQREDIPAVVKGRR